MDDLIKKVVEKLSLSVDKAPEVYEHLKMQFVVYDICNYFLYTLVIAIFFVAVGLWISFMSMDCSYKSDERVFYKKMIKYLLITLVILIVLTSCVYVYRNLHTQDIVFLKEIL
jgi:hypothetical protein